MEKFGPGVQSEAAQRYAAQLGPSITHTYEDTGPKARREALDRLLNEAPRFEAVIISSVDRLARRVPIAYGVLRWAWSCTQQTGTVGSADRGDCLPLLTEHD